MGYLWAIQHGATQIYETDDDNELKNDQPPSLSNLEYYVYNASGEGLRPDEICPIYFLIFSRGPPTQIPIPINLSNLLVLYDGTL